MAAIALAILAFQPSSPAEARQQGSGRLPLIVVVDATAHIDLADATSLTTETIATALSRFSEQASLDATVGLVAFGGAPRGDETACAAAIESPLPLGTADVDSLDRFAADFTTAGDGSVMAALAEASAMADNAEAAAIVLIAAALADCDSEVIGEFCAGLANRAVRIHVLGLALDEPDVARLRCLTETTGGSFSAINVAGPTAADEIAEFLTELTETHLPQLEAAMAVAGASEPPQARLLSPRTDSVSGEYHDTIDANGDLWYELTPSGGQVLSVAATVFELPPTKGLVLTQRLCRGDDCGSTRRVEASQADSVSTRCWACLPDSGDANAPLLLHLSLEAPGVASSQFPVKIRVEEVNAGSPCLQPEVCWFRQQIAVQTTALEAANQALAERAMDSAPESLVDEREAAEQRVLAAQAEIADLQASAQTAMTQARDLELQASVDGQAVPVGPILLVAATGLAAAGVAYISGRRDREPASVRTMAPANVERLPPAASLKPLSAPAPVPNGPGWWSDPESVGHERWWDGQDWTRFTRPERAVTS